MAKFEIVSKYKDEHDIDLIPKRGTKFSAGYDMVAAEDIVIPPAEQIQYQLSMQNLEAPLSLNELKVVTKTMHWQTSLIPTGVKCRLADNEYLKLTSRSSVSLNDWLICANSVGK